MFLHYSALLGSQEKVELPHAITALDRKEITALGLEMRLREASFTEIKSGQAGHITSLFVSHHIIILVVMLFGLAEIFSRPQPQSGV